LPSNVPVFLPVVVEGRFYWGFAGSGVLDVVHCVVKMVRRVVKGGQETTSNRRWNMRQFF
jgi:hypothetical protein